MINRRILQFEKYNTRVEIQSGNYHHDYNFEQNIRNKLEKSSKIGQEKKSLTSAFACFLTAIAKI